MVVVVKDMDNKEIVQLMSALYDACEERGYKEACNHIKAAMAEFQNADEEDQMPDVKPKEDFMKRMMKDDKEEGYAEEEE